MNISTIDVTLPEVEHVKVTEDTLMAELSDGRTISVPLGWYPKLMHATAEERRNWRPINGGSGIYWPDLNADLSVEDLFAGCPSGASEKSVKRCFDAKQPVVMDEPALVHGWLMEVNWACGTAKLHLVHGRVVPLRFEPALNDDMRRLATQYVEIRGRGRFNDNDNWNMVFVEQVSGTRSWSEPFDLEAFRNAPNPKIFDPEKVVTVSEPFDVDEFIRTIQEGRDAGQKEFSNWNSSKHHDPNTPFARQGIPV